MKLASRLGLLSIVSAAALLTAAYFHPTDPGGLTIHEWGTFTSVAGEDGSSVDWDSLGCSNDLPSFVNDFGYRGFKWRLTGTVRMETPVMYFYSQHAVDTHVKVSFPLGLITEWYPRADYEVFQRDRADGLMHQLPANINGIDTSLKSVAGYLEWKNIKVEPDTSPAFPTEMSPSRYYAARATDAAPITVDGQHEKFLFYRGVGRLSVPLNARAQHDGKIAVKNLTPNPVPTVILFENRGGQVGYRNVGAVAQTATLDPPSLDGSIPALRQEIESALVENGLYSKEAYAMVETWRDSWFEEGSRLIYILPTPAVNEFLPLEVTPRPLQTARVFVGRIELITPYIKDTIEQAIAKNDVATLSHYGRFLKPIFARLWSENTAEKLIEGLGLRCP